MLLFLLFAALFSKTEMEEEMQQFRELQLQEKKVFLANLAGVEKALKEKEREIEEVRTVRSITPCAPKILDAYVAAAVL